MTDFWQKLRESEKLALAITLVFLGLTLFALLSGYFLYYLLYTPQEQLRVYLESWQGFFATIFFYLLAGISGLLILWLAVTLILLCLDLLGITLAAISALVKGFVTESLYWADRLKKLLKHYVQRTDKRL